MIVSLNWINIQMGYLKEIFCSNQSLLCQTSFLQRFPNISPLTFKKVNLHSLWKLEILWILLWCSLRIVLPSAILGKCLDNYYIAFLCLICEYNLAFPFFLFLSFLFFWLLLELFFNLSTLFFNFLLALSLIFFTIYSLFYILTILNFSLFFTLPVNLYYFCPLIRGIAFYSIYCSFCLTLVHVLLCLPFHCIWGISGLFLFLG